MHPAILKFCFKVVSRCFLKYWYHSVDTGKRTRTLLIRLLIGFFHLLQKITTFILKITTTKISLTFCFVCYCYCYYYFLFLFFNFFVNNFFVVFKCQIWWWYGVRIWGGSGYELNKIQLIFYLNIWVFVSLKWKFVPLDCLLTRCKSHEIDLNSWERKKSNNLLIL